MTFDLGICWIILTLSSSSWKVKVIGQIQCYRRICLKKNLVLSLSGRINSFTMDIYRTDIYNKKKKLASLFYQ